MRLPPSEVESDGPNMTPVIDMVFLLLIFFLCATKFDQEEREVSTNLPEVAESRPMSMPPDELVINVTRAGEYIVVLYVEGPGGKSRLSKIWDVTVR